MPDSSDRKLKGIQFLQRSLRCLTQKSGWDLEVGSVEETLKKSNVIVEMIFLEDDGVGREEASSALSTSGATSATTNEATVTSASGVTCASTSGVTSASTSGVTVAMLSSLKMVVRTIVAKLDKKYGEALPSEDSKMEVGKLKVSLTEIDERIKVKRGTLSR